MRPIHLVFAITLAAALSPVAASAATQRYDRFVRQTITAGGQRYVVDRLVIDLANPKLRILTLTGTNKSSCYQQPCQTRSLLSYVQEAKAFAGINGTYFCPREYPSCAGQAGGFYWMILNARKGIYVNQKQNRFNTGPLVTFDATKHWQIYPDASVFNSFQAVAALSAANTTAAISNGPLLVNAKKNVLRVSTLDTKQRTVKSARSALAFRGTQVHLMVVHGATVVDSAKVMTALGMDYAINLDGGGSSALWYRGSYKVGPGRAIPNALLFTEN